MTHEAAAASTPARNRVKASGKRPIEAADIVIGGSVALVVLIVGIFVLLCFQGFDTTIRNSKAHAQLAANTVAEETRWVISSSLGILNGLASSITSDPAALDPQAVAAFRAGAAQLPDSPHLDVFDSNGSSIPSLSSPDAPTSIANRDYFQKIAEGADWSLSRQEAAPSNGDPVFVVAKRLQANGAMSGVATIVINANVLIRFAEVQDLGPGSTISIVRNDGWVIARHPSLTTPLDLSQTPAFVQLTSAPSGSYMSDSSPADGVARIVAFRHLDDLGYIAAASISKNAALGGLWNAILIVSLLLAPIAVTVLVGSFATAGLLRRTQATSRSLGTALEQNERLFREIHHRVKNNLESVNSLLRLQKVPPAIRDELSRRLFAMSSVHEHIYRSSNFAEVRIKSYLHSLIANIKASYNANVEVVEEIEDVPIHTDAATPLGLLVNEVVSNSFKHAFPDGRRGMITVSLKDIGDGRARLNVRDNGVGLDPDAPSSGIGRRLVSGFVRQLQGESEHSGANGSEFSLTFPL